MDKPEAVVKALKRFGEERWTTGVTVGMVGVMLTFAVVDWLRWRTSPQVQPPHYIQGDLERAMGLRVQPSSQVQPPHYPSLNELL